MESLIETMWWLCFRYLILNLLLFGVVAFSFGSSFVVSGVVSGRQPKYCLLRVSRPFPLESLKSCHLRIRNICIAQRPKSSPDCSDLGGFFQGLRW